ncbi:MAG: hypothetical protein HYZ28_19405 [Myxococcales bacterium]|nr:hypothetical protein [Myxococcales bacterium]
MSSPTKRSLCLAVLLIGQAASAQILIAGALNELNNAGMELQAGIQNQMAQAINEKNWNKLVDITTAQAKQVNAVSDKFDALVREIDTQVGDMERSRGANPDAWGNTEEAQAERAKYRELKAQREKTVKARDQQALRLKNSLKDFFRLVQGLKPQDMERMGQQLIARQRALGSDVNAFVGAVQGLQAKTSAISGLAKPIQLKNDAKAVAFIVNGVRLDPGQKADVPVPADRVLKVRAEAMTDTRKLILEKAKNPTRNAAVAKSSPWEFEFTVNTGAATGTTTWKVTEESYEWSFPGNPDVPAGESSSASSGVFPTVKNDVFSWSVPKFFEARYGKGARKPFWLATRGSIDWSYVRKGSGGLGNKTEKKSEFADGSGLNISVAAE